MPVGEPKNLEKSDFDKDRVNAAVADAENVTGFEICVVVGDKNHRDPRQSAERIFRSIGLHDRPAVMIVVVPTERTLELVTAAEINPRLNDSVCDEIVRSMSQTIATSGLTDGLVVGIKAIQDRALAAGPVERHGEDLPNVVDLGEAE